MAIIGIDVGTSNSAAAVLRGGRPVLIPSAEGVSLGGKAFPSYVAITAEGQLLVGEPARRQAASNPEGTATAFKRRMGTRDRIQLRGKSFSPEQLSAFLLQKIKRDAEAFLGEPVEKAVVTVPAYFDDNQRNATKDAARIAGLEVARLVNEPTAAALAYGLDRLGQELRIAVIDLGGGTLDVTIMEFGKGVFEVRATSGDTRLGGTDMNQNLFDELARRYLDASGIDVRRDAKAAARLMEAAEVAKIELFTGVTAHVSLPYIGAVAGEPRHLELDLSRAELERLVRPVIERCRAPVEQALHDAGVAAREVERLVFVGGSTRLPEDVKKRMVEEAERYAEADRKRREDAEKLNDADGLCYQAERTLADFGDKLTDELKNRIEAARRETRDACKKRDAAAAADKAENLRKLLKEAGVVIYSQSQGQGSGPYQETRYAGPEPKPDIGAGGESRPSGSGPRGRVVDADYKESR